MNDDDEERQAEAAEILERSANEFIKERHDEGMRRPGHVEESGEYGHPFHDRVAAYIKDPEKQRKLQNAFAEGFYSQQRDKAIAYLRSTGIINDSTPTEHINEFLAAWNIAPLPSQESDDVTVVDVGETTLVSPSLDDEIIDAEIIEE
jgi:hypothetical protein